MESTRSLEDIAGVLEGEQAISRTSWFGLPCLKSERKIFAALTAGGLALKLPETARERAVNLLSAQPFDPRGSGKPFREWIVLPDSATNHWLDYAASALDYVKYRGAYAHDDLISGLVRARAALLDEVGQLSPARRQSPCLGYWDVNDLLAHLAGWDDTNREAVEAIRAGQKPAFWQFYDRDWATYNQMLVSRYRLDDTGKMVSRVSATHDTLIAHLQAIPPDDFLKFGKIGTLLRAEIKDEEEHARQLRAFHETGQPQ